MSRASRVPRDESLSPELRKFHDQLERRSQYIDVNGNADFTTLKQGGDDVITVAGGKTLESGIDNDVYDIGTVSTGTVTIDPINGQHQKLTNNGAFTLSPETVSNYSTVSLHITNAGSAGAVTFSDWNIKYSSQTLTTTDEDEFNVVMYFFGSGGADYAIFRRQ